ncbi:MAG: sigma-54-dependent Fis family transcriptional regulator [Thermodesulfobacteriota bacterium]
MNKLPIDDKEFFRQATVKICGSLDISKALRNTLAFLRGYLPADGLAMVVYHPDEDAVETVAGVLNPGTDVLGLKIGIDQAYKTLIDQVYAQPHQAPQIRIVNRMSEDALSAPVARSVGQSDASCLQLRLRLEGEILGILGILNSTGIPFSQDQGGLVETLNEPFAVALSNYLRYRQVLKLKDRLADDNRYLREELRRAAGLEIVGADMGLKGVMDLIRQVAPMQSPVLLLGETGSGKELIANAIHDLSPRQQGPFIKVNCGAIPGTLMDSELFGHEKGSFTGAISQKRGRFERAHGGTIFLDEIGELPLEAQVRLLRVLQDKEIERVGGTKPIKADIRVVAATHRNLESMMAEGGFREDLYFRLWVFPIVIPPLRDRMFDLPALVSHFILKKTQAMGLSRTPSLSPTALERMKSHSWPGNVRELENAVERAIIMNPEGPLSFEDMAPSHPLNERSPSVSRELESYGLDRAMAEHIMSVMRLTGGRVHGQGGAADLLEINPSTLRQRMKKLKIPFGRKATYR